MGKKMQQRDLGNLARCPEADNLTFQQITWSQYHEAKHDIWSLAMR
jgi:hypothetical protein